MKFLAGLLIGVALGRWWEWEKEPERGVGRDPSWGPVPAPWPLSRTTPLHPNDPLARFYPPGTSQTYTADPPDPYPYSLATYAQRRMREERATT